MSYLIIDYDSTFIKLESLDELSKNSKNFNKKIHKEIIKITELGMEGKISFSESLEKRLKLIRKMFKIL